MPSKINKRGKMRYIGNVMVDGVSRSKLFPDLSPQSYKAAKEWEDTMRWRMAISDADLTVDYWINEFFREIKKRVTKKTYGQYRAILHRFMFVIGTSHIVDQISKPTIQKYIKSQILRSGAAINGDIKVIKRAWWWGQESIQFFPDHDPFTRIKKYPENRQSRRYVPSEAHFWQVYKTAGYRKVSMSEAAARNQQDQLILLALFYTAARPIELFRLRIEDLNFENNLIRLWSRKGKYKHLESRWVHMCDDLGVAFKHWLPVRELIKTKERNCVFVSLNWKNYGKPFQERRYFMRMLCAECNVKPFGMYGLRHLRAQIEYGKSKNIARVQRLLGHSKPSTTDLYLRGIFGDEFVSDDL